VFRWKSRSRLEPPPFICRAVCSSPTSITATGLTLFRSFGPSKAIAVSGGQRRHAAFARVVAALSSWSAIPVTATASFRKKLRKIPRFPMRSTLAANRGTRMVASPVENRCRRVVPPGPGDPIVPATEETTRSNPRNPQQPMQDSKHPRSSGTIAARSCSLSHGLHPTVRRTPAA